jgi:hypothetical protein
VGVRKAAAGSAIVTLLLTGATGAADWVAVATPAAEPAFSPSIASDGEGLWLSWIELSNSGGRRLRVSRRRGDTWGEAHTVHSSRDLLANQADTPRLWPDRDNGVLRATWPERIDSSDGLGVRLSASGDGGASWSEPEWMHDDLSATEHGFGAIMPASNRAVWLDGRDAPRRGPTTLRTRRTEQAGNEEVLDDRVCECCSLDTAFPHRGPVVIYRDRSDEEVRDISIVRETGQGWVGPSRVAEDGWRITGCPVQGPAVASLAERGGPYALSDLLLAGWFSAADDKPTVKVAFSTDAGASFARPLTVDGSSPIGRVDVELLDSERGWVSWLDRDGGGARLKVAAVGVGGSLAPPETVDSAAGPRAGGVPRLALAQGRLYVVWAETGADGHSRLHLSQRTAP